MKILVLSVLVVLAGTVSIDNVFAELEDLKQFIPDYYNFDEKQSVNYDGKSELKATILSATITKDGGKGIVSILQFTDENQMWNMFKGFRMSIKFAEDVKDLPATCYEGWANEQFKTISCIKNDFFITVSTSYGDTKLVMKQILNKIDGGVSLPKGGGCLIATAAYGSEMAPQVQQLRELRDNSLLQTASGTSFMSGFNDFYYSFSPTIADWERENPVFKEFVKITLTPMISSLSILNYVDMDSEINVLGYGISLIMLNIGMYFMAPVIVIIKLKQRL